MQPQPKPYLRARDDDLRAGLVLGLALPTGFFAWVLGFDAIKKRINGRLWCSDADKIVFDVNVVSSGATTRYSDTLTCRKDGGVVRTIGDLPMTATTIASHSASACCCWDSLW